MSVSWPWVAVRLAVLICFGDAAQVISSSKARQDFFRARHEAVIVHNSKASTLWTAALNQFSNMTDRERSAFVGYTRGSKVQSRSASFLEARSFQQTTSHLAAQVDHRGQLKSAWYVQNQGDCGSCWAVAAAGAMEMRLELANQSSTRLSWEQLIDCVPNPNQCGGDGGCSGATAELAFRHVQLHGIAAADEYSKVRNQSCLNEVPMVVQVKQFVQLPANRAQPLLAALADGPVVTAVFGGGMYEYGSGIFDSCPRDVVLNHAVLLTGYGQEGNKKYWLVRNSWGMEWGEKGYIRLLRHDKDNAHCGVDIMPQEGTGCADGPAEITVCGMCGILSDSAYPVGTHFIDPSGRQLQ